MKVWEIEYNGNSIRVENKWCEERLFVNDELQDKQMGVTERVRLWGELPTGEQIKVSIGGVFRAHCMIFINNKVVLDK